MSERADFPCYEKILQLWGAGWHATHRFVAANSGQQHSGAARGQTGSYPWRCAAVVARIIRGRDVGTDGRLFLCFRIVRPKVQAGAAAFFLDLGEVRAFVPAWL